MPTRHIGSSDQAGVFANNVVFALDNDKPVLRLRAFGGDDSSAAEDAAWGTDYTKGTTKDGFSPLERQGADITSRNYYATGVYVQCVKFPTDPLATTDGGHHNTGAVTAFWPFSWKSLQPGQPGFNEQGNPIRNAELDIEIPGSDLYGDGKADDPAGTPVQGTMANVPISYRQERDNSWGAQWAGEGGNMTSRPPYQGPGSLYALNHNAPLDDGKFHQLAFIIYGGGKTQADGTRAPGFDAWYFNSTCAVQSGTYNLAGQQVSLHSLQTEASPAQQQQALSVINPFIFTGSGAKPNPNYNGALGQQLQLKRMDQQNISNDKNVSCPKGSTGTCGNFAGNSYARDNIPFSAMRYWLGIWFPGGAEHVYPVQTAAMPTSVNVKLTSTTSQTENFYWGWGGTPDFFGEPGYADFECDSKAAQDTTLVGNTDLGLLPNDYCQKVVNSSTNPDKGFDPKRIQFLKDWKAAGGVRMTDGTVDGVKVDNERDTDLSSVVVLPYDQPYFESDGKTVNPNFALRDPGFEDQSVISSHFICISKNVPAGCDPSIKQPTDVTQKYQKNYPIVGNGPAPPNPPHKGSEQAPTDVKLHMNCATNGTCQVEVTFDQPGWQKGYTLQPVIKDVTAGGSEQALPSQDDKGATGNSDRFQITLKPGDSYDIGLRAFDVADNSYGDSYNPGEYIPGASQ